jgi:outer membrane protein assembly factor BamB
MPLMLRTKWCGTLAIVVLSASWSWAANWPQFRGPGGNGTASDRNLPVRWSATENVAWKTDLPGHGTSSPIVWEDKIFLTCYSGYGLDESDPGDETRLVRHLVCLARDGGKILWTADVPAELPEQEYQGFQALHGFASSTPATDGQSVYTFFGKSGVMAFDFNGKELWKTDVGQKTHNWGSATSPVLFGDLVIVNASVESGDLVALNKANGGEVWRARGMRSAWNTPVLVDVAGKQELAISIKGAILGFDPATGKELWRSEGIDDYICPSVVAEKGIVYAIGGRKNMALAVRAGGRGDVTNSHLLWTAQAGSNVSSPVVHQGHLYWVSDRGIAYCLNTKNGDIVYQERLSNPGRVYASVTVGDGKLYAVTRERGTFVLAAKPEFELLAENQLGDDSIFNGSPSVSNGQLLLRSDRALYCIGPGR